MQQEEQPQEQQRKRSKRHRRNRNKISDKSRVESAKEFGIYSREVNRKYRQNTVNKN